MPSTFSSVSSLAILFASGNAVAADYLASTAAEFEAHIQTANATPEADTIRVAAGVLLRFNTNFTITGNLTIEGATVPGEIDNRNHNNDSVLWYDVTDLNFRGTLTNLSFFTVSNGGSLTLRNIVLKQPEILCDDGIDNDGNGLTDNDDPGCPPSGDTGIAAPIPPALAAYTHAADPDVQPRAIFVRSSASLTLKSTQFQGWSFATEGGAVRAVNPSSLTIEDSLFNTNIGLFNPGWDEQDDETPVSVGGVYEGRGIVYVAGGGVVNVTGTTFRDGRMMYGGAMYFDGTANISISDSTFYNNQGEDGGALHIIDSKASLVRNRFVGNAANLVPLNGTFRATNYEGGAIYVQDSRISVMNNVFARNSSHTYGATLHIVGHDGTFLPAIVNNDFVDGVTPGSGGDISFRETSPILYNNIFYSRGGSAILGLDLGANFQPSIKYNGFFGFSDALIFVGDLAQFRVDRSTNLFEDPRFAYYDAGVDVALYDTWRFWLAGDSAYIDRGNPNHADYPLDVLGVDPTPEVDPGGSRVDIGAFGGSGSGLVDNDGDGWPSIYDCNDSDPTIFPMAAEPCDGIDNDCNGIVDDYKQVWFQDWDTDGYGVDADRYVGPIAYSNGESCNSNVPTSATPLLQGAVWSLLAGDCNDDPFDPIVNASLINPGQAELCDGIDNNCNTAIDEGIPVRPHYPDLDGDGFASGDRQIGPPIMAACPPAGSGYTPLLGDCDDSNPNVRPLITSPVRDAHYALAVLPLETSEADMRVPANTNAGSPTVKPAYVANDRDEDCDGVDLCFVDSDGDRYGSMPIMGVQQYVLDSDTSCKNGSKSGTAADNSDCDDGDATIHPNAREIPGNGLDDDCNQRELCWYDGDHDGYGSNNVAQTISIGAPYDCSSTTGFGPNQPWPSAFGPARALGGEDMGDCDDNDPAVNPAAVEVCDGIDNNCNGEIDENTGAEKTTYYPDQDGDGFGAIVGSVQACSRPTGYVEVPPGASFDCNDNDPTVYPGATEFCNGVDDNCDGRVDENTAVDVVTWHQDLDGDGYGNAAFTEQSCNPPGGDNWVSSARPIDCDDNDASIGPCARCGSTSDNSGSAWVPGGLLIGLASLGARRRRKSRV